MDKLLLPAVLWIAFIETSRSALAVWDAAHVAAKEFGSAPLHLFLCLALWACSAVWLCGFANCFRSAWPKKAA